MKAVVQERYGPPATVLALREIEEPQAGVDEVLVRVRATSAHADVWHAVTGRPYVLRLAGAGVLRPKDRVPGMDVAGEVAAVGPGATRFSPGDEVFGATRSELSWRNGGAFAEIVAVPAAVLARKPPRLTFEQAAVVPISGFIALANLRSGELVPRGARVLINGAGGAVGTLAVQLVKRYGGHVTAVDASEKLEALRTLGADEVVDYRRESVLELGESYDLVLDVASTLSLGSSRRILTPNGVYVLVGHDHYGRAGRRLLGSLPRALALLLLARFAPNLPGRRSGPRLTLPAAVAALAALLADGALTPLVDRLFPLGEAAAAMRHLASGTACGGIALAVGSELGGAGRRG